MGFYCISFVFKHKNYGIAVCASKQSSVKRALQSLVEFIGLVNSDREIFTAFVHSKIQNVTQHFMDTAASMTCMLVIILRKGKFTVWLSSKVYCDGRFFHF